MKLIRNIIQFHRNPTDMELSTVSAISLPIISAAIIWTAFLFGDVAGIATFVALLGYLIFLLVKIKK